MRSGSHGIPFERKIVLLGAAVLFGIWAYFNFARLTGDQNGILRLVLGLLFSVLILFRPKPEREAFPLPSWTVTAAAAAGTLLVLGAIILEVHQFEWLGLLLLLFACLRWALPDRFAKDILLALVLLYWVHPLPGQVFASLELGMQRASVAGAERALHCANVRAWGDGLVLRTGFRDFLVPEECSGMKMAVTVLLSSIGIGVLLRLRWRETLGLVLAGVVQVLILNIIRIFVMVKLGAQMPQEWATSFLHDTLGIFLLIAVFLVNLEAVAWRRWRQRRDTERRQAALEKPDREIRVIVLPKFWQIVFRWGRLMVAAVVLVGGVAFVVYKGLPHHRAEMIRGTLEGLIMTNPEAAERAIMQIGTLDPGDENTASDRIRVLILRKKYGVALEEIQRIPVARRDIQTRVMEAEALVGLKRSAEAMEAMRALPESIRKSPIVAMIAAELAAINDQPELVVENLPMAAKEPRLAARVRTLFPYLAVRERWDAIRKSDPVRVPYTDPKQAVIAVSACLKVNDIVGAAEALRGGLKLWPNEPMFINPILSLAYLQPGADWETFFASSFQVNLQWPDADDLSKFMDAAFRMQRPDLGWLAFTRLRTVAPGDLALYLAPAKYADTWFTFRKHQIGLQGSSKKDTVDLRMFYHLTRQTPPWAAFWQRVPLAEELAAGNIEPVRRKYVEQCLAELRRLEAAQKLSRRTQLMYPTVLAMAGLTREAHEKLDALEKSYPDRKKDFIQAHIELYEREGSWQNVYECLRRGAAEDMPLDLLTGLRWVNSLQYMDLGVYSMAFAEKLQRRFPDSDEVRAIVGAIWYYYGFKEEALFAFSHVREMQNTTAMARLLYEADRFKEGERVARTRGDTYADEPVNGKQALVLPPADWSLAWRAEDSLADADYSKEAAALKTKAKGNASPFVRDLVRMKTEWYETKGTGDSSNVSRWLAVGRDPMEQAVALNELVMLLAMQKKFSQAAELVGKAVELCPESSMLHRIRIALAQGDRGIVEASRAACPTDPEIWLMHLAVKTRHDGPGDWALQEVREAIQNDAFSPGTMVRASDCLLTNGMIEAASEAARHAIEKGRGYLPTYVAGLRCALAVNDRKWALTCALNAVQNAVEPWPFYKIIVGLKAADRAVDSDLITALEQLTTRYPNEARWAEALGDVYFQKGEMDRAFAVLEAAIQKAGNDVGLHSLLVAAEAARIESLPDRSVRLLELAYSKHPESFEVLNNLVYYLAQDPRTLARAKEMLPPLLKAGGESFAALDTAAVVCLKSGDLRQAELYMNRALRLVRRENSAWSEMNLNAAEIQYALGKLEQAQRTLELLRANANTPAFVETKASVLMDKVNRSLRAPQKTRP